MATISLSAVNEVYPNGYHAVHDLDLDVADGEFMVLVGPSGCGKTTLLRMVAGLEEVSSGEVWIGDRMVNELAPRDRDIAMVFQNYALYPQMTVAANIGFALKLRRIPAAEARRRVKEAAEILGLTPWLDHKPGQLSGGQRQRVAMGRALVREPTAFLMDEPLSNLDARLRVQMRTEITRVQRRLAVATIYVTHDQTEAMTMGDRVAVLRDGRLQQCDVPQRIYDTPANLFVANFIGSPAINLLAARVGESARTVCIGSRELAVPESFRAARPGLAAYANREVVVGLRPEHLRPAAASTQGLTGDVELVESLGWESLVHFVVDARRIVDEDDARSGGLIDATTTSVARVPADHAIKPGERVTFAIDFDHAQLFDPETGHAIRG